MRYIGRKAVDLNTLVISTHHEPLDDAEFLELKQQIQQLVIVPSLAEIEDESKGFFETKNCHIMINPLGMWTDGGQQQTPGLLAVKSSWIPMAVGLSTAEELSQEKTPPR
jgi:S-adenosylmethionine synthetase